MLRKLSSWPARQESACSEPAEEEKIPFFAEYSHGKPNLLLVGDVRRICIPLVMPTRDVLFCIFLLLINSYQKNLVDLDETVQGGSVGVSVVKLSI
jgi:hypothetical protein